MVTIEAEEAAEVVKKLWQSDVSVAVELTIAVELTGTIGTKAEAADGTGGRKGIPQLTA